MDAAGYVIRQSCTGRNVGRALLLVGLAVCVYQAYRRWQARRVVKRLAGKVVLVTGASSGLGEGEITKACSLDHSCLAATVSHTL